jgi:hypothetical protein
MATISGEGLRAGQHEPPAQQLIGEQRVSTDSGQDPLVDGRRRGRSVRSADDVTGTDLGCPQADSVRAENAGPQAHPLKGAPGDSVLNLFVEVPAIPGRLVGGVVLNVDR